MRPAANVLSRETATARASRSAGDCGASTTLSNFAGCAVAATRFGLRSARGTIPERRDYGWMGVRRDVYVVVEFDERRLVRICIARDVFTFLQSVMSRTAASFH